MRSQRRAEKVQRILRSLVAVLPFLLALPAKASDVDPSAAAFFETKVRPVLADHCFRCHGEKKQKSHLRVDSLAALRAGGDRGPAVAPGDPDGSLLVRAVRYADPALQMPPGKKLAKAEVEALARWVHLGAPWPGARPTSAARSGGLRVMEQDRAFWSFRPVRRPPVPVVGDPSWAANPVDAFVLARLEARGLRPRPPAGKRELIRRAYFDLLGLPPSPEEVDAFVRDAAPDAWPRLIDRLLAAPAYGERWGRHWLDVVRYAQTNGYERDDEKPYAWRYRDYVIGALNRDEPYDRFLCEQLAGDLLRPAGEDGIVATGFYRLGVWDDEPDDPRQAAYDELDDMVATIGQAFLGLTLNCARCHDHKFDPIPQRDYYRVLAFLHGIRRYEVPKFDRDPPGFARLGPGADQWALAVKENAAPTEPTHVLIRGSAATPGEVVGPGFPSVLEDNVSKPDQGADAPRSPGRLELARWIARAENPLTARVIVNRLWQHHFGRGLVPTPNDFGRTGLPPTHPELLDWLAAELTDGGWRLKRIHRLILTSNAYRMSSRADDARARAVDEGNTLWWRQNLRRLEAEALRDAALAVGGRLDRRPGGRGVFPRLGREVIAGASRPGRGWEVSGEREQARRSVYLFIKRTMLVPLLEGFDYTNTAQSLAERPTTTVAPQALLLLNSEFMQEAAAALAARAGSEAGPAGDAVGRAYRLALGREPTVAERGFAAEYLRAQAAAFASLPPTLTFTPRAPSSLHHGYLAQLRPRDVLAGPADGWDYSRGRWGDGYEEIDRLDLARGPFALWQGEAFADGGAEGWFRLHAASELGGLLFRAGPEGEDFAGYDVTLDPRRRTATLRRHAGGAVETFAEAKAPVAAGQWQRLRVELSGARIQLWLDQKPILDVTDRQPILAPGRLGFRTWGAALSARDWIVRAGGETVHVDPRGWPRAEEADRRALESFCLVLLNLNEFAYVD